MKKKQNFFGPKREFYRNSDVYACEQYCQECPFENECKRDNVVCESAYKELTYGN